MGFGYPCILRKQGGKKGSLKESDQTLATPATVQLPDGGYAAILEGNLGNYAGMSLAWRGENQYGVDFTHGNAATFVLSGEIVTPWRIVAVADDLDQLVNNTIVYQVCDAPEESLFDGGWVKPVGRSGLGSPAVPPTASHRKSWKPIPRTRPCWDSNTT